MAAASAAPDSCGARCFFAGEKLIEPFGMDFAAQKIGFGEDAAEEAGVGLDAGLRCIRRGRGAGARWFLRGSCPRQ